MPFTAETVSGIDPFFSSLTVLHVLQPTEAGVWRYASDMAGYQAENGWEVHVACPVQLDSNVMWHPWQAVRSPIRGVREESRRIREIVRRVRPEVIVAHSSKAGLVVRLTVRGAVPTVFLPHAWSFAALDGPMALVALKWERIAAAWTNAVVCVGEGEARTGVSAAVRVPYFLVPNPVPKRWTTGERSDCAHKQSGMQADAVFVGRLSRQKGVDHLLAAWQQVRRTVTDASLLIVGDGPDRAALEAVAGPGVRFVGAIDQPWTCVELAGICVLPSRWEGLSLSMLEAMWSGRSIVMTDVDGSEVVAAARAGAVVPVGDVDALSGALVTRLKNTSQVEVEGRRAAAYVRQNHDFGNAAQRLAAVVARAYAFGAPARR